MSDEMVLKGPRLELSLPTEAFGKMLFRNILQHGDKEALVFPVHGVSLSFRELARRAAGVAMELTSRGIGPGHVVALGSRVEPEFGPLVAGALLVGAIPAPFNPELDRTELSTVLGSALRPRLVVSQEPALSCVSTDCPVVSLQEAASWMARDADPEDTLARLAPSDHAVQPADCAAILCSSGTTGAPKGVQLTHRMLHAYSVTTRYLFKMTGHDYLKTPTLSTMPVFWASGFIFHIMSMDFGITTVFLPKFEEEIVAKILNEYKMPMLFMPPNVAISVAKNPDSPLRTAMKHLRMLQVGGTTMTASQHSFVQQELGLPVSIWYGMTEGLAVMGSFPTDPSPLGSVGKLMMNVEAKVVDRDTNKSLGPNEEGELCIRSPTVSPGYWNDPEATAAAFDEDGWFHTGDVAYYDEKGNFFIIDRFKELVKFRGHHLPTSELEALLTSHPGVRAAAVVGVPHDTDQEHPRAYVIRQPGASVTEQELVKLVQDSVADHKRLRGGVRFVSELPMTPSGKVIRRALRHL